LNLHPAVSARFGMTPIGLLHSPEIVVQQAKFAPGAYSGWHVHPGLAIVQVQEGSIQIYENGCTPKTVAAGDTSIEIPYEPVRAIATGHVVWTTTFVVDNAGLFLIPLSTYSPGSNPCPSLP